MGLLQPQHPECCPMQPESPITPGKHLGLRCLSLCSSDLLLPRWLRRCSSNCLFLPNCLTQAKPHLHHPWRDLKTCGYGSWGYGSVVAWQYWGMVRLPSQELFSSLSDYMIPSGFPDPPPSTLTPAFNFPSPPAW